MKILKRLGKGLLLIFGLLAVVLGLFAWQLTPDYDGEKTLKHLTENVQVYYDTFGIPHIYGENEMDAFRALGYVHAQDRLWQMELLRRIASGRLAEVFGEELVKTDKFFLALGVDDVSVKTVSELNQNEIPVQLSQAYLDGVNEFIAEGATPIEFYLTGIDKEPFELKDIYNTMGYMAFSFAMAHKTDPLLTQIKDRLGYEYIRDLPINSDSTSLRIQSTPLAAADSVKRNVVDGVMASLEKLSIPLFEGSNSWVLSPEKTKNGKVIFANDPHIGFSQPSVWYEAHVSTPAYEKYGYHLAGVPFPLLGHDRTLAYGMTMFENDDIDFYYEESHATDYLKYRKGSSWGNYETVHKTIKVKDAEDVQFSYKKTHRGPILNGLADQIAGDRPVSMWWVYTEAKNKVLNALYGMSHARDRTEFENSLKDIHAPGLNIMYGDVEGNVAWWASAKLYHIPDSVNTKFIYEPNQGLPTQKQYLDFSNNPHAINPESRYVYSANNQPDSIGGRLYPGYYLPENRARRIVQLLDAKNDWDMQSVSKMINDVTSPVNIEIVQNLLDKIDTEGLNAEQLEIVGKLKDWKGDYPLDSIEATVYHRWLYLVLRNIFQDELGKALFDAMQNTHFLKRTIASIIANEQSIWWDNISTEVRETPSDIITSAFRQAWLALSVSLGQDSSKWEWHRVHTLEHAHPIGQLESLRPYFNVGPFPVNGSREVINNMYFPYTEDGVYKVSSGPSTRRVIDFSDVENSISILPTGQSGNPFSPHYKDQAEMYIKGEFRKMMMNKEEIVKTSESLLIFEPADMD
ncbi:penicillin acylase family protein [Zobellia sp. OII3]|uniref:penicillin acylase family protein n=1 Tax=Zobellia sp. OII3 TaxID=2034520 RepID=UPI000B5307C7|nr:penicillin acylase family protein [Zobellia sp. OII3]OWW26021.1 penicillin acylase family protein [Zobellia sp. OII3]